ncbi:hypothetical protein F5882DRAFT_421190 [Hyaloscypha sp. PMI_1271]|nr:hypothetical protein F5882DRAFT_421190 [Hyaloscypha sp. PMI_1271]
MTPFSSIPTLTPSLTQFFLLAIHLPWGPKRAVRGDPVQRPHNSDVWVALPRALLAPRGGFEQLSCTVPDSQRKGRDGALRPWIGTS